MAAMADAAAIGRQMASRRSDSGSRGLMRKRHTQGRVISFLEGGYNLAALGRSVAAHLRVLLGLA